MREQETLQEMQKDWKKREKEEKLVQGALQEGYVHFGTQKNSP
jgi:hypothetical protein